MRETESDEDTDSEPEPDRESGSEGETESDSEMDATIPIMIEDPLDKALFRDQRLINILPKIRHSIRYLNLHDNRYLISPKKLTQIKSFI